VPAVHLTEGERRDAHALAADHGHQPLMRAMAAECPNRRGLTDEPCPCHVEAEGGGEPSIVALLSFYDEPVESLLTCISGLASAGVEHLVAVDGAYAIYPDGEAASDPNQHAAITLACRQLSISCTLHIPSEPWAGNEVQKRSFLFKQGAAHASPGDWLLVIDADEVITSVPADLRSQLAATDLIVASVQMVDAVALRAGQPDWPAEFEARRLFRAQPIRVQTSHFTYVTADGRYLWGDESVTLEPSLQLDMVVEHHPDRRPTERLQGKMHYYRQRDRLGIERGTCAWCDLPAERLVAWRWQQTVAFPQPVAQWKEACAEHAAEADETGRNELRALGLDPDRVRVENRNGQRPALAA
jgi:hypothetical protein